MISRFLPGGIELSSGADAIDIEADDVPTQQVHSVDAGMSAPSINVANELGNEISGHGLALIDCPVEQDRAYWEWRVKISNPGGTSLMFGVSNKRNAKFYEILAESTVPPAKHGTKFMGPVMLNDGDVLGVVVNQSELPMIQFYLNGDKVQDGGEVSRFRGTVYPSIFIPEGSSVSALLLYGEDQFLHGPPNSSFTPLIAERSLM